MVLPIFLGIFAKNNEKMKENNVLSKKEMFFYLYDFLKRNGILAKYILNCVEYHREDFLTHGINISNDNLDGKGVLYRNIERFADNSGDSISYFFISYDGSFDWSGSKDGHYFWSRYLKDKWRGYLKKNNIYTKRL